MFLSEKYMHTYIMMVGRTSGVDGHFHGIDCGDSFMSVFLFIS
jgi:hypothetical protein